MCKFSDEKDGNYLKVAEVLERWAKELKDVKVEDDASVGPPCEPLPVRS